MKVSERIKELQVIMQDSISLSLVDHSIIVNQLIQLEVEIVEALQVARQEGEEAGYFAGWQDA